MYRPLALYIGLRYTRAKRRNHFLSFISLTSMIGIALGVAVLITVLSVMNGFDYEINKRFFGMAPEITINNATGKIVDWPTLAAQVKKTPGVVGVAPFIGGQGLMTHYGQVVPAVVTGVLPEQEVGITEIYSKMVAGKLTNLTDGSFGIVLGKTLADSLSAAVGDKVTVMIPQVNMSIAGMIPRFKRFTVVGIFNAGTGFNFDSRLSFINLHDAQKLYQLDDTVSGLRVKINNVYQAPAISLMLASQLTEDYQVGNWTEQFGAFFKTIKLEKTMMFLILMLIIVVAVFNLVSSLVMVVTDKQAEIAILRTMGALPRTILAIFIVQGLFVGVFGMLLGLVSGVILALNATNLVNWIQKSLHMQLLSSSVYFVDYLPSRLELTDVVQVCIIALFMSLLATIYPAWRAAQVQPAEALKYE